MIKTAYLNGVKRAYDMFGVTPAQMSAGQQLGGVGGGLLGAGIGGLLGHSAGGGLAKALNWDEGTSKTVGAGLGALVGGGLGGYAGTQLPRWSYPVKEEPTVNAATSANDYVDYDNNSGGSNLMDSWGLGDLGLTSGTTAGGYADAGDAYGDYGYGDMANYFGSY